MPPKSRWLIVITLASFAHKPTYFTVIVNRTLFTALSTSIAGCYELAADDIASIFANNERRSRCLNLQ